MSETIGASLLLYGCGAFITTTLNVCIAEDRNLLRIILVCIGWPVPLYKFTYRAVYKYIDTKFWNDLHELISSIPPDTLPAESWKVQKGYIVADDRPLEVRYEAGQWKGGDV